MRKNIYKFYMMLVMGLSVSMASCQQNTGKGGRVSAEEFEKLLSQTKNAQLIDVRTQGEFESGHIKNATNIDINATDFEHRISSLNKNKPVFVYCLSGGRSASAAGQMRRSGFATVYEMPGIMAWRNAGKELVSGNETPASQGMTEADYRKFVTDKKYVLVDFSAVWCQPCKRLTPIVEKIALDKKDKLILKKVDADANPELLKQKGIDGIPYLELYKEGKLIWKHHGFIDEHGILNETKL